MNTKTALIGAVVSAGLALSSLGVAAETAKQKAVSEGATQLTSEQIAALLVGKTVTARSGEKKFLFHYSEDNVLTGQLIGGDWSDAGYYGITDDDGICLSMSNDKGRLRCLTLLDLDGTVRKYNAKGDMTFELLEFQDGKSF